MQPIRSTQSAGSATAVRTALSKPNDPVRLAGSASARSQSGISPTRKPIGYGLPCAKCRKYYSAALSECPVCKSTDRMMPAATLPCAPAEAKPAAKELDEQKERFLREFKAKLYQAHMQINTTSHRCTYGAEDDPGHDPASVCRVCYERLQTRLDLFESALEMDLKEAAQIIYDAVWADTSDTSKTYMNAAKALLGKLRKRAGIITAAGRIQPLSH